MTIKTVITAATLALAPLSALAAGPTDVKAFAIEALTETLGKMNADAVDTYFSPGYIQHNPDVPNGADGLKGLIAALKENPAFNAEFVRVIADGDMVAFHSRYDGL